MTPDHVNPQRRIPRSRFLVKPSYTAPDPNPDIPEFPVKLNPKFSDPDVLTRIGFSSVHISFLAATPDIQYKKKKRLIISSYLIVLAPYLARMKRKLMRL